MERRAPDRHPDLRALLQSCGQHCGCWAVLRVQQNGATAACVVTEVEVWLCKTGVSCKGLLPKGPVLGGGGEVGAGALRCQGGCGAGERACAPLLVTQFPGARQLLSASSLRFGVSLSFPLWRSKQPKLDVNNRCVGNRNRNRYA